MEGLSSLRAKKNRERLMLPAEDLARVLALAELARTLELAELETRACRAAAAARELPADAETS
jgi:hypothetical protein